jgi:hypothetical protein
VKLTEAWPALAATSGLHWAPILDRPCAKSREKCHDRSREWLLWFAMFAIPMLIAVILRRRARKYGLADGTSGDRAQEPDYRR